ncbi:MAG: choice-of-anchor Q domain-containing protein [Janthinobacterium lividum]
MRTCLPATTSSPRLLRLAAWLLPLLALAATRPALAQYTPVAVSGFNADVVADGTGAANTVTTATYDNASSNNTLMVLGYNNGSATATAGLPVNGRLNSSSVAGLAYQLAPYSGNNSLRMQSTGAYPALVLSTPVAASKIYLAASGGDGGSAMTVTVTFDDNTTQAFTGVAVADWYDYSSSTTYLVAGLGRVGRSSNTLQYPSNNNPRIYELALAISAANQSKKVVSLTCNKTNSNGTINVTAVSVARTCTTNSYTRLYVNAANATPGTGGTWATALTSLADALEQARTCSNVSEIWVAKGTYLPAYNPAQLTTATDRNNTFYLKDGLKVYGGFAGTETATTQRTAGNVTVLSGDYSNDDAVSGSGSTLSLSNNAENAYHVLLAVGAGSTTLLDGLSVRGGNANGTDGLTVGAQSIPRYDGGGLYQLNSTLALTNCTFSTNSASTYGGGMYSQNAAGATTAPVLTGCTFSNNVGGSSGTGGRGAGFYAYSSAPTLTSCTFSGNASLNYAGPSYGGGLASTNSSPTLNGCTFSGNYSSYGGGMYCSDYGAPKLTGCTFTSNRAPLGGGGLATDITSPTLTTCTFTGNTTTTAGGGLFATAGAAPTLTGCLFNANTASGNGTGGALYCEASAAPALSGCTLSSNTAGDGGGLYNLNASPTLTNCVFYKNEASAAQYSSRGSNGGAMYSGGNAAPKLSFCTLYGNQASYGGTGSTGGGLYYDAGAGGTVANSILWQNTGGPTNRQEIYKLDATNALTVSYSLVRDYSAAGTTNVSGSNIGTADPLFVDADDTDLTRNGLTLRTGSPAISAANPSATTPTTDLLGRTRTGRFDQGAYKFVEPCTTNAFTRLYVNAANATPGTGGTWATALTSLAEAAYQTRYCTNVSEVWVAAGTYLPGRDPAYPAATPVAGDRNNSFYFREGLKLYGGFVGTETALSQRPASSSTILSGDYAGNDAVSGSGNTLSIAGNAENAYHVLLTMGAGTAGVATVLDGLAVRGGNANSTDTETRRVDGEQIYQPIRGGGLYNDGASLVLTNCAFSGNDAGDGGGGLYNYSNIQHSLALTNCTFTTNRATNMGGGMEVDEGPTLTLTNCTIGGNYAGYAGGGMYSLAVSQNFVGCTVGNNATSTSLSGASGGGIYAIFGPVTMTGCAFNNNHSVNGSGLYSGYSATLLNTTFKANTGTGNGGGMYADNNDPSTLTNCVLSGNTAATGGGLYDGSSNRATNLINCTLYGNAASGSGGGVYGSSAILNCILWNNTSGTAGHEEVAGQGSATPQYSRIQAAGVADPIFVNTADPDGADDILGTADDGLMLRTNSPAVNASNASTTAPTTDVTGHARSGVFDQGAYEATAAPLPVELLAFTAEAQPTAALLRWTTASEHNSAYFAVERSLDGLAFRELTQVAAQGQSLQMHAYTYRDAGLPALLAHGPVYYRLRQVDQDGTRAYSPVRTLAAGLPTATLAMQAAPNPLPDGAALQLVVQAAAGPATLTVYDALGRVCLVQEVALTGADTLRLAAAGQWPAGVYVVRLVQGTQQQVVRLLRP